MWITYNCLPSKTDGLENITLTIITNQKTRSINQQPPFDVPIYKMMSLRGGKITLGQEEI